MFGKDNFDISCWVHLNYGSGAIQLRVPYGQCALEPGRSLLKKRAD